MGIPRNRPGRTARILTLLLNGLLFFIIFLLLYLAWTLFFPDTEGMRRVIPCWLLAYGLTWIVVYLSKGMVRLYVTLLFFGFLAAAVLWR